MYKYVIQVSILQKSVVRCWIIITILNKTLQLWLWFESAKVQQTLLNEQRLTETYNSSLFK